MKIKGIISFLLILVMLFAMNGISAFAEGDETENVVKLMANFAENGEALMESRDNNSFGLTVNLTKGVYQFAVSENDEVLCHPTTINNTTNRFSSSGIRMTKDVGIKCTLLATGGEYTFIYNCDSDCMRVVKDGFTLNSGDALKIHTGDNVIEANVGDKINYTVFLKASELFEDVQTTLNFDTEKLTLKKTTSTNPEITDNEAEALVNCPNMTEVFYNSAYDNLVTVNASNVEGYDFKAEKVFLTLEFTVAKGGETYLDFNVQDMTALGGEKSYYFLSEKKNDGADFRISADVIKEVVPTSPLSPTEPVEPTAPTEPSTGILPTTPAESTAPADGTNPTEINTTPTSTNSTDPAGTTATTEPSEPQLSFELGDVTRDGKLNIKDVTAIQKYLAYILDFDEEQKALADYLADEKINIKDATQIQKKLANII